MPGDWQIRGSSLPQFIAPVPPSAGVQTVVYGLSNTKHHLMLTAPKGTKPLITMLRVYRPALAKSELIKIRLRGCDTACFSCLRRP